MSSNSSPTVDLLNAVIEQIADRIAERLQARLQSPPDPFPIQTEKLTYDVKELSALLGVGQTTLWRLSKRGLLNPIPGLRHRLYSKGEVHRFLSQRGK